MTLIPNVSSQNFALFFVPNVENGTALLTVKTGNSPIAPMSYRVWEYSDEDILLGYVTDLNSDVYDILPTFRTSKMFVLRQMSVKK
jgi:hypothetical protein